MYFYIHPTKDNNPPPIQIGDRKNMVRLVHSNWDDWFDYETIYQVYYYDEEGLEFDVGITKIGKKGMMGAKYHNDSKVDQRIPPLPVDFTFLKDDFFSLGQDPDYYENLQNLGNDIRIAILKGLNDIAYSDKAYKIAIKERVTKISLLRDVSLVSVTGQFRRLATGDSRLSPYSFTYTTDSDSEDGALKLNFEVKPRSNPSTNIHIIVGRNGVGKTHLITGMINSLLKPRSKKHGRFYSNTIEGERSIFANLIFVSFSAFDEKTPIPNDDDKDKDINAIKYSYVGLKKLAADKQTIIAKSPDELKKDFRKSLYNCYKQQKIELWTRIVELLNTDRIFSDTKVLQFAELNPVTKDFSSSAETLFNRYSSGHRIVLLTITKIIESIEERSLIILDEPESHLHPPLLASFTRALSQLLIFRNGVGIVATHSPVIVQEVPKSCIWTLDRSGVSSKVERLETETFGENVGYLTKQIFGLEVFKSGFYQLIEDAVSDSDDYEGVISSFDSELGKEAQAIARTLVHLKNKDR